MNDLLFANRMTQSEELLSDTEKRIAHFIIENKQNIKDMGISTVSKHTQASNSTVSRLISKLGYSGFGEFKAMISREDNGQDLPVEKEEQVTDMISSYYNQLTQSASELLDLDDVTRIVKGITQAAQVIICGIGNSGLTAIEFKYRLTRMGIMADALTDPHMMLMRTALLSENDVIIIISNSGKTPAILKTCQMADDLSVPIYAITNHKHTPLIEYADIVLYTSQKSFIHDDKFINSQLVSHFVLDVMTYVLLQDKEYLNKREKTLNMISLD